MSEKEYVVIVKEGEDLNALDAEMAASSGSGVIPDRAVVCADPQTHDTRMTHWNLTDAEAETLKGDDRVLDVERLITERTDIEIGLAARQSETFSKGAAPAGGVNWGLSRCNYVVDNFDGNDSIFDNYKYAMTGKDVDVVIMDSGIELDHPEFKDAA